MAIVLTVWVRRENEDDSKAEQVDVAHSATVSALKSTIVASKIYPIACNADIITVSFQGQALSTRTLLNSLSITQEEATFVITTKKEEIPAPSYLPSRLNPFQPEGGTGISLKQLAPTSSAVSPEQELAEKRKRDSIFNVVYETSDDEEGPGSSTPKPMVVILNKLLKDTLRQETGGVISQLYDNEPHVAPHQLVVFLNQLKDKYVQSLLLIMLLEQNL